MAGLALARLAELTGVRSGGNGGINGSANAGRAAELGLHGATMLLAIDWVVQPATHLVIVEDRDGSGSTTAEAMRRALAAAFLPAG